MNWMLALTLLVGLLILVNIPLRACTGTTYGNGTALLTYYSSSLCVSCWQQKPIIEQFVRDYPTYRVEEYDALLCPSPARAVPAFQKEARISYGLHTTEDLLRL